MRCGSQILRYEIIYKTISTFCMTSKVTALQWSSSENLLNIVGVLFLPTTLELTTDILFTFLRTPESVEEFRTNLSQVYIQ